MDSFLTEKELRGQEWGAVGSDGPLAYQSSLEKIYEAVVELQDDSQHGESRVKNWVNLYTGPQELPEAATDIPVVGALSGTPTLGGVAPNASYLWSSPYITQVGTTLVDSPLGAGLSVGYTATDADGKKRSAVTRVRFRTDAPEFELATGSTTTAPYNIPVLFQLTVDGKEVFTGTPPPLVHPNYTGPLYSKFSWGPSVPTVHYGFPGVPAIVAGGTGYAAYDTITLPGGTFTAPAVYEIIQIGGGGSIVALQRVNIGDYTVRPTGTLAIVTTSGSGTGAQVSTPVSAPIEAENKMRNIEVAWTGELHFKGININTAYRLHAWDVPDQRLKVCIVGDSQTEGTFLDNATSSLGLRIAQRLGVYDSTFISARGGTGWYNPGVVGLAWSHPTRVAELTAMAADVYIFLGSQNDPVTANTRNAVVTTLDQLSGSLPKAVFIGVGSLIQSDSSFIKAGWEASANQARLRYLDNVTVPWIQTVSKYMSSDGVHFGNEGTDLFADIAAEYIAGAIVDMDEAL